MVKILSDRAQGAMALAALVALLGAAWGCALWLAVTLAMPRQEGCSRLRGGHTRTPGVPQNMVLWEPQDTPWPHPKGLLNSKVEQGGVGGSSPPLHPWPVIPDRGC